MASMKEKRDLLKAKKRIENIAEAIDKGIKTEPIKFKLERPKKKA